MAEIPARDPHKGDDVPRPEAPPQPPFDPPEPDIRPEPIAPEKEIPPPC